VTEVIYFLKYQEERNLNQIEHLSPEEQSQMAGLTCTTNWRTEGEDRERSANEIFNEAMTIFPKVKQDNPQIQVAKHPNLKDLSWSSFQK
jgi:hypothetical protein